MPRYSTSGWSPRWSKALAYRDGVLSDFIALDWRAGSITRILDFRFAPYALESVTAAPLAA